MYRPHTVSLREMIFYCMRVSSSNKMDPDQARQKTGFVSDPNRSYLEKVRFNKKKKKKKKKKNKKDLHIVR